MNNQIEAALSLVRNGSQGVDPAAYIAACLSLATNRGQLPGMVCIDLPSSLANLGYSKEILKNSLGFDFDGHIRLVVPEPVREDWVAGQTVVVTEGQTVYIRPKAALQVTHFYSVSVSATHIYPFFHDLMVPQRPRYSTHWSFEVHNRFSDKRRSDDNRNSETVNLEGVHLPVFKWGDADPEQHAVTLYLDTSMETYIPA